MFDPIYQAITTRSMFELIVAAATWPRFSLTSFAMAKRLRISCGALNTIIDVGANSGQFSVAAAYTFPEAQIIAFEPNPDCYRRLLASMKSIPTFRGSQFAIGDADGVTSLRLNSHSHSSSILPLSSAHKAAFPFAAETGAINVEIRTLDVLLSKAQLRAPCLLKVDVQGYEMNVLRGAKDLLTNIDFVVLELSFDELYEGESTFEELAQTMRVAGFQLRVPVGWLSDPRTGKYIQMDALFCRK